MVSIKCREILKNELQKTHLSYSISPHGAIEFHKGVSQDQLEELNKNLRKSGLELLDKNDSMLIHHIINTVIDMIHNSKELPRLDYEDFIGKYAVLDNEEVLKIFSDVRGISIIQFIVLQKIERIKDLLLYDDLSLSEITNKLRYKNENYLISQFKKHTGLYPEYFTSIKHSRMALMGNQK